MTKFPSRAIFLTLLLFAKVASGDPVIDARQASAFLLHDMSSVAHNIDDILRDGPNVVLVFWQTWCKVCIRESPALAAVAREHKDTLRFFGVVSGGDEDVDDKKVRSIADKLALPYPQVRDRDLTISKRYQVTGTPTIIILGPQGSVLFNDHKGPADWSLFRGSKGPTQPAPDP